MPATALLPDLKDSSGQRQTMVDCQIRTFGVTDQRLIDRCLVVPRERFLPDDIRALAYSDIGFALSPSSPGAEGRYLLPPLILARLIQGGRIGSSDKVLDVACGTGYSTAILAGLAREVVALEDDPEFARDLPTRLSGFDLGRVQAHVGDLTAGASEDSPFDVILLNGAIERSPDMLFSQLAEGGRLLAIFRVPGDPTGRAATAMCFEKRGGEIGSRALFDASAPVLRAFRRDMHFVF